MSAALSPFRLVVTILLMVSMPLCCCNFRSFGGCCPTVGEAAVPSHSHADGTADEHVDCHGGHHSASTHPGNDPCRPAHYGDDQCACGKSMTTMGLVGKTVVEIPTPVFVMILPALIMPSADSVPLRLPRFGGARPPGPPDATLLRLHCALTI